MPTHSLTFSADKRRMRSKSELRQNIFKLCKNALNIYKELSFTSKLHWQLPPPACCASFVFVSGCVSQANGMKMTWQSFIKIGLRKNHRHATAKRISVLIYLQFERRAVNSGLSFLRLSLSLAVFKARNSEDSFYRHKLYLVSKYLLSSATTPPSNIDSVSKQCLNGLYFQFQPKN